MNTSATTPALPATSPTASWLDELPGRIADLKDGHLLRVRRTVAPAGGAMLQIDGQPMLAFCSNDYLGLASHPALATAACEAAHAYGLGSGGSPLVSGHSTANALLEHDLARFVGLPRALYFYAGYATNVGIVPALVGAGDALFSDALNHACLIDGARLSRATIHRYPHADLTALEAALASSPAQRKLVVTDAVFSMDGDVADIPALLALCERYDALLLIDDAHGFGVLGAPGQEGRGTLAHYGLTGENASPRILYMATLGKAAGVCRGQRGAGGMAAAKNPQLHLCHRRPRPAGQSTAGQRAGDANRDLALHAPAAAHRPPAHGAGPLAGAHAVAAHAVAHAHPATGHWQQCSRPGRHGSAALARPVGTCHSPTHRARGHRPPAHCAVGGAHAV